MGDNVKDRFALIHEVEEMPNKHVRGSTKCGRLFVWKDDVESKYYGGERTEEMVTCLACLV